MARVETIIGSSSSSGIAVGGTFALNGLTYVSNVGTPTISTTPFITRVAGPPEQLVVSDTNGSARIGMSAVIVGFGIRIDTPAASTIASVIEFGSQGVFQQFVGMSGGANNLITGSVQGDVCIGSNRNILFSADLGVTKHIAIVQTTGVMTHFVDRAVRFDNQTSAAGAGAGTLANAPTAGNPGFWLKINIGGTNYAVPCWLG